MWLFSFFVSKFVGKLHNFNMYVSKLSYETSSVSDALACKVKIATQNQIH